MSDDGARRCPHETTTLSFGARAMTEAPSTPSACHGVGAMFRS